VKSLIRSATALVALAACCHVAPLARAQSGGAAKIAVVDIDKIFRSHNRFRQMMTDHTNDVQKVQADLRKQKADIREQGAKELRQFEAGSVEYKRAEESFARKISDLQLRESLAKKDLMEREAKIYHRIYQEISREVAAFAQRYRLDAVLRYDSTEMDPRNPKSVIQGLRKSVVYHGGVDITKNIIDKLNGGAPPREEEANKGTNYVPR